MKRATKIVITVATALSLGLAAAIVSAHPSDYAGGLGGGHTGGYGPGYAMGHGMMGGYGPGYDMGPGMMGGYGPDHGRALQGMFNGYPGNAENGLAALKAELGITAAQDVAWQAFTNNAERQNESRQAWFARMHEARTAGSLPERLAQQTEFMKQRRAEMEANAAALKDLYATLTPEQKAIADQRFGGFGPGYGMGYGRGYHGGQGGRFR